MSRVERSRTSTARRHRSLRGCTTCRNRHVRCDEGFPSCSNCERRHLICGGYENLIAFGYSNDKNARDDELISLSGTSDPAPRRRRPLFTEVHQRSMSQALLDSAPIRNLANLIRDIDQSSDQIASDNAENIDISRGPFGVFRGSQSGSSPILGSDTLSLHDMGTDDREPMVNDIISDSYDGSSTSAHSDTNDIAISIAIPNSQDEVVFPWSPETMQMFFLLDEQQNVSPSSLGDTTYPLINSDPMLQETFDSVSVANSWTPQVLTAPSSILGPLLNQAIVPLNTLNFNSSQNVLCGGPLGSLPHAAFLVSHYNKTVLTLLSPIKHSKTPWHILFIPQIKNCLAAFTLNEAMDHAGLTIFYGALAISALSLGNVSNSPDWLQQAQTYYQRVEENAKMVLQSAYDIPKSAKYKASLMALLTVVYLSTFVGNQDQAGRYLLETEKLIRLRGLNRHKSRKIRLLHHCYVFERLFRETVSLADQTSQDRLKLCDTIENSGVGAYSVDGLHFRLPNWLDLDQEMSRPKDKEIGENDLHLAHLGEFSSTLYPEIFGTPEHWMQTLSLIIRLGQEKNAIERNDSSTPLDFKTYMVRAKAIEKRIVRLNPEADARYPSDSNASKCDDGIGPQMLRAVKQALLIYFYRRIYDLDVSMLQHNVAAVKEALIYCYDAEPERIYGSTGFIWPSFIAACEAEGHETRQFFTTWFSRTAHQSGLPSFNHMIERMKNMWAKRDET